MKYRVKIISISLCFAMFFGMIVCKANAQTSGSSQNANMGISEFEKEIVTGYSLEKTGTFKDQEGLMSNNGMLTVPDGDGVKIISGTGDYLDDTYYGLSNLYNGYITVKNSISEVNSTGLYSLEGEELIPCEAAAIDWIENYDGTDCGRYLIVAYGDEETTNKNDAAFDTSNMPSPISGTDADYGDVMYTGYGRIFDTENNLFVENLRLDNNSFADIIECGEHFVIITDDKVAYLYDSKGKETTKIEKCYGVGNGYIIKHDGGAYDVYDEEGTLRFSSKDNVTRCDSTSGYLIKYTEGKATLVDLDGNQVLPEGYKTIYSEIYGLICVETSEGEQQLLNRDGEVLVSASEYIYSIIPGYYYFENNGKYGLVGYDGVIVEDLNESAFGPIFKENDALVIKDKDFSLHLDSSYCDRLAYQLIASQSNSNGKYGVFDLFTGQKLLDYQFTEIKSSEGYVYTRQDNTWTSYKVIPQYK